MEFVTATQHQEDRRPFPFFVTTFFFVDGGAQEVIAKEQNRKRKIRIGLGSLLCYSLRPPLKAGEHVLVLLILLQSCLFVYRRGRSASQPFGRSTLFAPRFFFLRCFLEVLVIFLLDSSWSSSCFLRYQLFPCPWSSFLLFSLSLLFCRNKE